MSAPSAPGNPLTGETPGRGVIRVQGLYPHIEVKDRGGYQSRHAATLAVLREVFLTFAADFAGRRFDFFIGSFDNPESCNALAEVAPYVLAYSVTDRCLPNVIAIPDFIYGGWPEVGIESYDAAIAAIGEAGKHPPLHDKIFWIGNAEMHASRRRLLEIGRDHPDAMEFIGMNWQAGDAASTSRLGASRYVSLPEHAAYGMLLDIRGAGYSGRLKLLMHAGRPVFLVERPFREFFYQNLRPYQHYMPVKADLSDLAERVAEVKHDEDLARRLGQGASSFAAQYLSRDYALRYWRDVLLKVSDQS